MQTYTVYDRERHEKKGKPFTFQGRLLVEGHNHTSTAVEYGAIYQMADGNYLIEAKNHSMLQNDPAGDGYEIVPPDGLRSAVLDMPNNMALKFGRVLDLGISEQDYA